MFSRLLLPPYGSLKHLEGKGNYAIKKYYQFPYYLFYRHKLKMIVNMLGDKTYENILDFGSGPGIFTSELKRHAHSVKSFEINDVIDWRWKFDVIVCASVFEFLPALNSYLNGLGQLMRYKSFMIVGSPMDTWLSRLYFKLIKDTNKRHSHIEILDALRNNFNVLDYKEWLGLYFVAKVGHK